MCRGQDAGCVHGVSGGSGVTEVGRGLPRRGQAAKGGGGWWEKAVEEGLKAGSWGVEQGFRMNLAYKHRSDVWGQWVIRRS